MKIRVRLKKLTKARRRQKWDMCLFKANVASFSRRVEERIQPKVGISIEDRWKHLKNTVVETLTDAMLVTKKETN